ELKNFQRSSVIEIKKSVNRGIGGFVNVNGTYLMFSSEARTWAAAKDDCARFGSRLVVAPNMKWLLTYIQSDRNLRNNQYWVGASDQAPAAAGKFEWLDGTPVDSDLWSQGYPSDIDYDPYEIRPYPSVDVAHPGEVPHPGEKPLGIPKAPGSPGFTCVKLNPYANTYFGLIATHDTNCRGTETYHYICQELM
ncbi:unnamed protein product, partial [Meganyctiphanes norvegica]